MTTPDTIRRELPSAPSVEAPSRTGSRRRRVLRRLGTAIIVLGVGFLVYGAAIYFWRDPVTDLYARWKQHQLADDLTRSFEQFRASAPPATEVAARSAAAASSGCCSR